MKRIAKFEKVSYEQFLKDWIEIFKLESLDTPKRMQIKSIYDAIRLPKRSTSGSAGYDFVSPINFELYPNKSIIIPTGIRVRIEEGWVLKIYPRSGLGIKFRTQLDNTVGIVDSDYYYSDNEGHIFVKITNDSKEGKTLHIDLLDRIVQGVFCEYGITIDDDVKIQRNGGYGSTGK